MDEQAKAHRRGDMQENCLSVFKMVSLPLFFFITTLFFFPKETPTTEDVLTYGVKTATSSPHSAVETTLKKSNVCAANREVTCIHPRAVLADSSTFVCHSALFSPSRFASSERHFEFHITCRLWAIIMAPVIQTHLIWLALPTVRWMPKGSHKVTWLQPSH